MILTYLKKHYVSGKMFVDSWVFVPKEIAVEMSSIPGVQEFIPMNKVPVGFYNNYSRYFVEDGILRNGFGLNGQ